MSSQRTTEYKGERKSTYAGDAKTPQATESKGAAAAAFEPIPTPEDHLCPILQEPMVDPVVATDGHSYERSAITE